MRRPDAAVAALVVAYAMLGAPDATAGWGKGSKATPLEGEVRAWLGGKEFTSTVPLCLSAPNPLTGSASAVCTVASAYGDVRYVVLGAFVLNGVVETSLRECHAVMPVGTVLRVQGLDFDKERLELSTVARSGHQACVRIRFSAGWEARTTLSGVLSALSRLFDLGPAYARVQELDAAYSDLTARVTASESAASAADLSAGERMAAARELRSAVESAKANRDEHAALGGGRSAESESLARRIAEVDAQIAALQAEHADALRSEQHERAAELASRQAAVLASLDAAVRTDVTGRLAKLEESGRLLQQRDDVVRQLEGLGAGSTTEEAAQLSSDRATHERHARDLEQAKRDRRTAERTGRLDKGAAQARAARAKVESASGTPEERERRIGEWAAAIEAQRAIAREMEQAGQAPPAGLQARLGDDEAAVGRARAGLASQREAAALGELASAYAKLDAERAALRKGYTMAFRTSEQPARAAPLVEHLRRMIANREEAGRRGSASAAAQAGALRSELDALRQQNPGV